MERQKNWHWTKWKASCANKTMPLSFFPGYYQGNSSLLLRHKKKQIQLRLTRVESSAFPYWFTLFEMYLVKMRYNLREWLHIIRIISERFRANVWALRGNEKIKKNGMKSQEIVAKMRKHSKSTKEWGINSDKNTEKSKNEKNRRKQQNRKNETNLWKRIRKRKKNWRRTEKRLREAWEQIHRKCDGNQRKTEENLKNVNFFVAFISHEMEIMYIFSLRERKILALTLKRGEFSRIQ